jgi:1-acyl-sn-glycerol-3-phosphate acyltransferase
VAEGALLPPFRLWFNWRFEGLERIPPAGPLIVAGNHLSYLDPFAHGYFVVEAGRRPRFLAKRELFANPLVGMVLRGAHQIPVDRDRGGTQPLDAAAAALAQGEVVVIYPEGTSETASADFSPGPGKTGAVRLSMQTRVPILPVATWGGQDVWRRSGKQSLAFGRPIWLRAGEPFDPREHAGAAGEPDVRGATDALMARLTDLVRGLAAEYPARWHRR